MKKIVLTLVWLFLCTTPTYAVTGYIDTAGTNTAKVCYDSTCTSPAPSSINFELSQQPSIVIDSVTGISGYVWGDHLGWINMNPTGQGVTFANTATGLLTGKAWSQVSGWVNFAVTGQQVVINPTTGQFDGWAWSGGPYGGWIKFNCADSSACVSTTWKTPVVTPSSPTNHSRPLPLDVCSNIDGLQTSIPGGYTVDNFGRCVTAVDMCPNFLGDQEIIPSGYVLDEIGACVPTTIDYCPNIKGVQYRIPSGYEINGDGDCMRPSVDVCPNDTGVQISYDQCSKKVPDVCLNLPGIQEVVPDQYVGENGSCLPVTFDMCANIDGVQPTIPVGYVLSEDGSCAIKPEDLCDNLAGSQVIVPKGFFQQGEHCFFIQTKEETPVRVIAFSFIPKTIQLPSDNLAVKAITKAVTISLQNDTNTPYRVDLVSFGGVLLAGAALLLTILKVVKRFLF